METILLSAGQSSRMGSNKALVDIHGKKVIQILLSKLLPLSNKVFLVLGDNLHEVKSFLENEDLLDSKIQLVYNENHLQGMFTSIKKGFSFTSGHEMILLQMIDQPFVDQELYVELINFADVENLIFQPASEAGQRLKPGHPILFSPRFKSHVLAVNNDGNLRDVIRMHCEQRKFLVTDKASIFMNLNTPADVEAYLNKE